LLQLPGIYGRLGNLGTIENLEKYDVAISTACTRLDNIVVSDMDTAQKCVEYLRSENLGTYVTGLHLFLTNTRATFIILEKQRHLKEAAYARFAPPAHSERLFDLIKVQKEEVKLAFYFALQNTLVMKDLEGARKCVPTSESDNLHFS
jgi:structural maintenance of chromosome 4